MKKLLLAAVAMAALSMPAYALQDCKPVKDDSRVCVVPYNPDNVVRVWGTLRSITLLEFGKDETNPRLMAADKNALTFAPDGNFAVIKPKPLVNDAWAMQPLTIFTTLPDGRVRTYVIEYDLLDHGPITAGSIATTFKIKFTYPGDVAAAAAEAWRAKERARIEHEVADRLRTIGPGSASGLNGYACDYVEQHDPKHEVPFIPTRVCDNGQTTFMWFPGNMPVPAVTADGADGQPMVPLQNFDSAGPYLVLHLVAKHFYLRMGDALVCIWKVGPFNSVGWNSGTKTSDRGVVRELKGDAQ